MISVNQYCRREFGEKLYKMIIPNGVHGTVNSVGNITNASGTIVGRARFVEAGSSAVGTVAQINPAVMLMHFRQQILNSIRLMHHR